MEIRLGGTLMKLTDAGHEAKIICLTDVRPGHYEMAGAELAERRNAEAQNVAKQANFSEYQIWDIPDGNLEVNLVNRERLIGQIRAFAPDVLFTFRPWDYHPDHRVAAQLAWYFKLAKRQMKFLKDNNIEYSFKSWGKPIGIGIVALVLFFGISTMLAGNSALEKSTIPVVNDIAREHF